MVKRSAPSLHWLTLAVVIPLLILAGYAWMGLKAQSDGIRNQMQEEMLRVAHLAANQVAREFEDAVVECAFYPDPPIPGTSSAHDGVLNGADRKALASLRDSPEAGYSPAGLPRRVLAALRLRELGSNDDGQADEDSLVRLVTVECPSILTGIALSKAGATRELQRWEEGTEKMAALLRKHPEGGWIVIDPFNNGLKFLHAWVKPGNRSFRYLQGRKIESAFDRLNLQGFGTGWALRPSPLPGVISVPVPFEDGLWLTLTDPKTPDSVDSIIQRQRVWAATLLAIAVAVSLAGLWLLQMSLRRERQLNEMKSQFVASVSHELRAPVASIRLMADALEAEKVAPEIAKEFHRLISRESARLSTLVGNVLDHARIEQGKRVWKMEPCNLSELVADTLRVMEPLAREKDITLRSALSPVEASVDAGAIQEALVNLLDNAIKFSPRGSKVETSLSCHDGSSTWQLSVQDDGPGIPKEEKARIFERFYRPGDELRREAQGTGIGLSLVKAIAEAHGGSISVESEPSQGSTFTLTLPLAPSSTDH